MNTTLSAEKLIAEAVDAFNARDIERFLAVMDPDVEAYTLLAELAGTPYRGHAGVRSWWSETLESWDYERLQLGRVELREDLGVAFISLLGRGKASGVELDMQLAMVFRVRHGVFTYFRIYADREEALRFIQSPG